MKPVTHENHLDFCEELPLTKEEWRRWYTLRDRIWQGDKKLRAFIEKRVRIEQDAYLQASRLETEERWRQPGHHSEHQFWSNMIVVIDALAVLKRAQLVAYAEWLERN